MEKYGKTLRKIRQNLQITQVEISSGIMSQSNYSKMEKGEIDVPFAKMVELLNRLGMTVNEFLFIHNDYTNPLNRLKSLKPGDRDKMTENIKDLKSLPHPTKREQELLFIFEAFLDVLNNDYEVASEKVIPVWSRLEKHNAWYLYDISLINSILYLFPIDVAESIMTIALNRLEDFKKFRNIHQLSANFQINFILMLMENNQFEKALEYIEELISFSQNQRLYVHLGVSYVRKGILINILKQQEPTEWYGKGFDILDVVDNEILVEELKNEIELYSI